LKLKYEELLSDVGFKFNLRRYTPGPTIVIAHEFFDAMPAGAYTRSLFSST